MSIYVYPYTSGSESAKLLANRLGALRIKLTDSNYEYKEGDLVVNWGNSHCPYPCLNPAALLKQTINKLSLFRQLIQKGFATSLPLYWLDARDVPDDAFPVLCRTRLEGKDGEGIVIAKTRDKLVEAKLYTKLITDCQEYRVTVFKGYGVTDIQEKCPRSGVSAHPTIKTYANGWGFQRRNLAGYPSMGIFAEKILEATGLDFAGLDIIYKDGKYYVLEVNSAMGLEGEALERFAKAVEWHYRENVPQPVPEPPAMPSVVPGPPQETVAPSGLEGHLAIEAALAEGDYVKVISLAATMIKGV